MIFQDLDAIAAAQVPIVLPDTCILLDILRSPRRDCADARSVEAAKTIAAAVKAAGLVGSVVASQVKSELGDNRGNVLQESKDSLRKLEAELRRIDGWSTALGVKGQANITHGMSAITQCEPILDDWVGHSLVASTTDALTGLVD